MSASREPTANLPTDVAAPASTEERLAYLASFPERNPNPVVEADGCGGVRYANAAALRLFPDIREKGSAHPFLARWEEVARAFLEGSAPSTARVVKAGARTYHQELVRGAEEGVVRVYALDVTDSKREEHAWLDRQRQLALDAAGMGWWHYDPATRVATYDERYRQIFGVSGRQRPIDEILKLLHPEDLPRVWAAVEAALDPAHPRAYSTEYRSNHPGGTIRWIEAHGIAAFEGEGAARRATSFVGTVADITLRRRADDALRARDARFRALMRELHSGVALVDATGRFSLYNRKFLEMFGLSQDSDVKNVNDQDWSRWQVLDEEGRLLHVDEHPVRRAALTKQRVADQLVGVRLPAGGDLVWMLVSAEPLLAADDSIENIVCTYHDVTDRRRIEEALREADRRKDEFLGMLSHELRNPLAPIRNSIYVLRHTASDSEQACRAREIIERQTEHLTRLVDDLLDVTRIARGKIELRRSRVDLREIVSRAAEDFRLVMHDRGVALHVAVPDAKLWADADPTRITQIVGNLLHNASKFTRRGDDVTVSLEEIEGGAEIRVRDTGAGVDPALLPHVFDAFVQGERTLARTEGGLGLGLALVKGIAALHGGSAFAESGGKGKGATFVVRLPRAAAGAAQERTAAVARSSGGRRVLVVDDNADAADSLADVVRMLGHEAEVAHDGASALERARANPPDVVLCDLGLPGMSGYEVARALRAMGGNGMVLVAVSGYAQPDDVKRAIEAGFDGHVPKPPNLPDIERLLAT